MHVKFNSTVDGTLPPARDAALHWWITFSRLDAHLLVAARVASAQISSVRAAKLSAALSACGSGDHHAPMLAVIFCRTPRARALDLQTE